MAKRKPSDDIDTITAASPADDPVFTIPALRKFARTLFDCSPCAFDGATCNLTGMYSVPQMRRIIDAWIKKEVNING